MQCYTIFFEICNLLYTVQNMVANLLVKATDILLSNKVVQ
jgi:hypothetical protein